MSTPGVGVTNYVASPSGIKTPNVGVDEKVSKDLREVERLRSTSYLYQKYAPLWNFFLSAYEGGSNFACKENIFKHARENSQDYEERAKRLYYHNYCYPLVDFFTTFIFTETIQREADKSILAQYNELIADVNKKGEDVTQFMMQVCDDMQIFGMSYVLVDTPPKPAEDLTEAQQTEQGIRPYWILVRPTEVLDWATDQFDKFTYLKRVECQTRIGAGMTQTNIERYTEWSVAEIQISEVDVTDPEKPQLLGKTTVSNELGKIPMIVARYKRSKTDRFMGMSFLNDIAFINREVMNLTSQLQEFLYRQCFNILAMEDSGSVQEVEPLQGEISTANMLRYAQGTKEPQYITPPADPAEFIQNERAQNVAAMYKIAAQDTQNDLFNGSKTSGFSKSQSFQTTVPKIATRAESLESAETQLMKLTFEYMGKGWNGTIKYKDHYQITNLTDALAQLSTLFKDLQINSKTFAISQMKRMIEEFDGKLTSDQREKVYAEIEAIDWDEWFDTMKLAFLGGAARAPEAAAIMDESDAQEIKDAIAQKGVGGGVPVKGKDTPTAASTAQRATSGSKEVSQESAKK